MFKTFFSSAYILLSVICLVFGLGISAFGLSASKDWNPSSCEEEQYTLEKKVYLISTFFSLGLYLKFFLIPLWFLVLESLLPFVPGSMCIFGIHLNMGNHGFYASASKFFIPAVYGYWLVLNWLDRKLEHQPFMKAKLISLVPIGIIFSLESFIDFSALSKISSKQVSCCSSIFDVPRPEIPTVFMETSWFWSFFFLGTLVYILSRIIWVGKTNKIQGIPVFFDMIFILGSFISFILALHTKISPLFLNQPTHHCVFCLWQKVWDVPVASFVFFLGIWLYLILLAISSHKSYAEEKENLRKEIHKILNISFISILSGFAILAVHLSTYLLTSCDFLEESKFKLFNISK